MLDIRYIRENAEKVQKSTLDKGYKDISIEDLLALDDERRSLQQQVDDLREQRNLNASKLKTGGKPDQATIDEGKQIKIALAERETLLQAVEDKFWPALKAVPNVALDEVPVGETEDENVEIRVWGEKPQFDFAVKNHAEIAEAKGWLDKERGAKIAGARFVYMMGDLVLLEMALWRFGMDVLTNQAILQQIISDNNLNVSPKAFTPILPPAAASNSRPADLVRPDAASPVLTPRPARNKSARRLPPAACSGEPHRQCRWPRS